MKFRNRIVVCLLLFFSILSLQSNGVFAMPHAPDCIIPPSGPWPPCATGSNSHTQNDCVIPSSGPWPPCVTGGTTTPSPSECIIPPSGAWPPCATGGGGNQTDGDTDSPSALTNLTQSQNWDVGRQQVVYFRDHVYFAESRQSAPASWSRSWRIWRSEGNAGNFTQLAIPQTTSEPTFTTCGGDLFISTDNGFWAINERNWSIKLHNRSMRFAIETEKGCYFSYTSPEHPYLHDLDLYRVSSSGTQLIQHWRAGNSGLYHFADIGGGRFVFVKGNGAAKANVRTEIYVSDGDSVQLFADMRTVLGSVNSTVFSGFQGYMTPGAWYAYNQNGEKLYEMPTAYPSAVGNINNRFLFVAHEHKGTTEGEPYLWATDGTKDGTMKLIRGGSWWQKGVVLNNHLYFVATTAEHGLELWMSDGTPQGTRLVRDINADNNTSSPMSLTVINDWLYFLADDGQHGRELWRTNGNMTERLTDINPHGSSFTPEGVRVPKESRITTDGSNLYFAATDNGTQLQLWRLAIGE